MAKGKTPRRAARSRSSDPKRRRKGGVDSGSEPSSEASRRRALPPTPKHNHERRSDAISDSTHRRQSLLRPAAEDLGFAAATAVGDLVQNLVHSVIPLAAPHMPSPVPSGGKVGGREVVDHSPSARLKSPGRAQSRISVARDASTGGGDLPNVDAGLSRHAFLLCISSSHGDLLRCQHDVCEMDKVAASEKSLDYPCRCLRN